MTKWDGGGGGQGKFYSYEKDVGQKNVLAMLKGGGGHNMFWDSFNMGA